METWELEFEWLRVQHTVKDAVQRDKLPDLQAILFLIGIQEIGMVQTDFTKEEKQDLMHVAVCELLSQDGYYEFIGKDEDGWPHYKQLKSMPKIDVKTQEHLLKQRIIDYFRLLQIESERVDNHDR